MSPMDRQPQRPSAGAVALTAAVVLIIPLTLLLLLSEEPLEALRWFLLGPGINTYYAGNTLNTAALLTLTGLGTALAFRAGLFNLGGEGQLYLGSLAAALTAMALPGLPLIIAPLAALTAAALAGTLPAAVAGGLKGAKGIDELLTTYLLSAALLPLIDYAVGGPLKDTAANLLATPMIPEAFRLTPWLAPSTLNLTAAAALLAAGGAFLFLYQSRLGFLWRIAGKGTGLKHFSGISPLLSALFPLTVSGGLHGLAGGFLVLGTHFACIQGGAGGLGWSGIAVALIARLEPLWVIPAALLMAWLQQGAEAALLHGGLSAELGGITQGLVLLLVGLKVFKGRKGL